jgi:tRNA A-37 threonylcarbamoyl transferase component Bud32
MPGALAPYQARAGPCGATMASSGVRLKEFIAPPLGNGRFELREVLGSGGMAIVYRAYDTRLHCERAIKVLAPALSERTSIRNRFITEGRTMARLSHPNIVPVHEVVYDEGPVYMVMEMVRGGSLMEILKRHGPMPPKLASAILQPILSGLALAHQDGIIHRDIKPHNILMSETGIPKLTDFGIAQVRGSSLSNTRTNTMMGTLAYMAPEQRSSARRVDVRSDVYSMGATLYTLLTLREPHDIFAQEIQDELLQGVDPDLAGVIRRATKYKPEDRFQSARDMLLALRAIHTRLPDRGESWAGMDPAALGATSGVSDASPSLPPAARTLFRTIDGAQLELRAGTTMALTESPRTSEIEDAEVAAAFAVHDDAARVAAIESLVSGSAATEPTVPEAIRRAAHEGTVDEGNASAQAPQAFTIGAPSDYEEPKPVVGRLSLRVLGGIVLLSGAVGVLGMVAVFAWVLGRSGVDGSQPGDEPVGRPVAASLPSEPAMASQPVPTLGADPAEGTATASIERPEPVGVSETPEVPTEIAPSAVSQEPTSKEPASKEPASKEPASKEPASKEPASAAMGTLGINSVPWGHVRIDGVERGTGGKFEVPAGSHEVELTTEDGRTQAATLDVVEGGRRVWCWDFDKGTECLR